MITKVDDDLKLLVNAYTEKSISLSTIKRKKNINLITSELEDFLEPKHILLIDPINTENLLTLLVIVPKALESGNVNRVVRFHLFIFNLSSDLFIVICRLIYIL
jgi:predicted amidophosphoribosyltransferase